MSLRAAASLLKTTYWSWSDHNAPRLGAALAYYALLSLSPLAMLLIALCSFVLKQTVAEQHLLDQTRVLMGAQAAKTLGGLLENAQHRGSGLFATVIALLTLTFGASGVFVELRNALNIIWDAPQQVSGGWRSVVKDKVASVVMVLGCGGFVLLSAGVSAAFALAAKFAGDFVPVPAAVAAETLNLGISLVLLAALFGVIYKTVPNVPLRWRDVAVGAIATSVLFVIGRALLSLYLTKAAVGSTYGAAGSLVALVVWVYYSAQIFFFGAVFTRVYGGLRTPGKPAASAAAVGKTASNALK